MRNPGLFVRVVADVKIRRLYTCSVCDNDEPGTTEHVTINAEHPECLHKQLEQLRQTSKHMPVGWGYNGKFTCPECNRTSAQHVK